ncbi:NAD(P)/FAD-dependent oxidoreductase [Streptomyces sp. NPDC058067]|uniref:NAD(P)/FAD-dependent oxidoreductase n=1 Tax=Streptomyces sp. NPDC058067 TaxID=3346324 RepID=UPI0036F1319E
MTSRTAQRCVIVGGSLAGLRAAEAVRRSGFTGEVLVFGAEPHMPYNRPPLSKGALEDDPCLDTLTFRLSRATTDVSWRIGTTVRSVDLRQRSLTLADGTTVGWDGLVIATGARPRRLDLPGPAVGRHVVRTAEDAMQLRQQVYPGARVVVLGAGFIGCEVAATCSILGADVQVVAPETAPMHSPLGHLLGQELRHRHDRQGVRFHLGVRPTAFVGAGRVRTVRLSDGSELAADVVVEAVGTAPNTDPFEGNGLDLSDGVVCDGRMNVEGHPAVVACGDVARFPNPLFDRIPRRVEHWNMAVDTARRAGRTLGAYLTGAVGDPAPFLPMPSFWSDQYDWRIQSFGLPGLGAGDIRLLEGDLTRDAAVGYHRDGALVGVVMLGLTARHAHYRSLVAAAAEQREQG